jgi:hypothetical protein
MSHIKRLKSTPTCFDQQLIIIREFMWCLVWRGMQTLQSLHTRHHVKQTHAMLPHYHITTNEDSSFN